jgi:hypothetical protein
MIKTLTANNKLPINPPILIEIIGNYTSWGEWLEKTESSLKAKGYRRYEQNIKNESFAYWKLFENYYKIRNYEYIRN